MSAQGAMSQEQPHRPLTYGDLFDAKGDLASMPVTKEDALMMQNAEALTTGQTKTDSPACIMQSAADKNLQSRAISPDRRTIVPEGGVVVAQLTTVPGDAKREYIIAGQTVVRETTLLRPTDPIVAREGSITIGEALEAAALGSCDKPVEAIDARAIKSAEERATGLSLPMKDGIAATAQSAAQLNPGVDDFDKTTIGDILTDASSELGADKLVTQEDARKVREAELRGQKGEGGQPGVIAAALQAAANMNTEI
ncbi:hypothetical protein O6H91_02G109600 [Diphasiastrum complanatum]|uniref:Uncharacterized protein n=3 Tax=Diphasiastrum complanatum TaxID=34168 RepID=A0ACC2EJE4_DIPCM|nr:hypothetical protein O6H91_02G109600 [Diphasiastrum complanatum]KAJ7566584.1 hypothetical protein O6H91_02G109600 [Diphasiastrum complanatum]KAJ7566585.1 hypothetical protein O6H91_02G109600 [Diphasiastrum complanatum]